MPSFGLTASDNWLERWFVLFQALPELRWVETGFLDRDQLPRLGRRLRETGVAWGIHFPLIKADNWPALIGEGHSSAKRQLLGCMVRESFKLGAEMGASYLNLHLPFYMRGVTDADFLPILRDETGMWAEAARATGLNVHLENARFRPGVFAHAGDFLALCRRHQGFRLCLDPGHLYAQVAEGHFQAGEVDAFIAAVAPQTASAHIYQFRTDGIGHAEGQVDVVRCPVVPGLQTHDGWADLPRLLRPVLAANPDCLFILDHGYGHGAAALREEMRWLEGMCG